MHAERSPKVPSRKDGWPIVFFFGSDLLLTSIIWQLPPRYFSKSCVSCHRSKSHAKRFPRPSMFMLLHLLRSDRVKKKVRKISFWKETNTLSCGPQGILTRGKTVFTYICSIPLPLAAAGKDESFELSVAFKQTNVMERESPQLMTHFFHLALLNVYVVSTRFQ